MGPHEPWPKWAHMGKAWVLMITILFRATVYASSSHWMLRHETQVQENHMILYLWYIGWIVGICFALCVCVAVVFFECAHYDVLLSYFW